MPEGPELHLSSLFVKRVSDSREFVGKIGENLPANRPPRLVEMNQLMSDGGRYTLTSWSRGKELMVAVKPADSKQPYKAEEWTIRFNFGMTGCFKFTKSDEIPKHAKVCFTTCDSPAYTLSFVDYRGFGRWTVTPAWSENRGPCILQEHDLFRAHVLSSLSASVFNKPICEAMLDQRYFNGVGNYLRAEVLYRLGLRPFDCARDLLSPLPEELKVGRTDLLQMCHQLATEVVAMGGGKRYDVQLPEMDGAVPAVKKEEDDELDSFEEWLQCYYQPGMKNLVDHCGRTMWFSGPPGKLVPKGGAKRHGKPKTKASKTNSGDQEDADEDVSPKKRVKKEADAESTPTNGRAKRAVANGSKAASRKRAPVDRKKTAPVKAEVVKKQTPKRRGVSSGRAEQEDLDRKTGASQPGRRRSQRLTGN